jgi:hypothetical protein
MAELESSLLEMIRNSSRRLFAEEMNSAWWRIRLVSPFLPFGAMKSSNLL